MQRAVWMMAGVWRFLKRVRCNSILVMPKGEHSMNQALPKRAQFHHMKDGTQEDWEIIGAEFFEFRGDVCKRIKDHLMLLDGDCGGFPVDRLTHCLQTATLSNGMITT